MADIDTDQEIARVLREARTIAVLGAHSSPERPAMSPRSRHEFAEPFNPLIRRCRSIA